MNNEHVATLPAPLDDVPPGYKRTEVGVIPEDWRVFPLGSLATVSAGGTPSRTNPAYWGGDIPWVTTAQVNFNTITSADEFITKRGLEESAAKLESPSTLLIALYGQGPTRGRVAILGIKAATNQACAAIAVNSNLSPFFLFHYLSGHYENIRGLSNKGNQANLNGALVKAFPVAVPSLPEQRAIAAALGDVDALIAALDALIAKKRAVKQAAMHQLLTGTTQLPGFSGEWEVRRIGNLAPLQRGFDLPTSQLRPGPHPVVYSNGVMNYHNQAIVKGPGVITGRSGTIGKVHFVEKDYWPHNTALWVTSFGGNDPKFVYYLYTHLDLARFLSGSGVPTLNRNDVHIHEVACPSPAEQRAIAAVLTDMDAEITALEQRRDKTKQIKQGMMQQLLTGRVRLA
jgi:type I restriction enzyme, S subunit